MKQKSARNKNYWIDKGYSEIEAINLARSRQPGTIEYFNILKGYDIETSKQLSKEYYDSAKITLENCIKKYGVDDGKRRWESYCKKQSDSNKFEYKQRKYGWDKDKFDEYNKSRAVTLDNLIQRHGDEIGRLKWEKYCDRQRYAGCQLEYFIEKYGEADGIAKYQQINKMKSHTFESYLLRFNDPEVALSEFKNYVSDRKVTYSQIANELFDTLFSIYSPQYKHIYYANNINEWFVYDNNQRRIFYVDFFVKELGYVIEFYGDYWHANPKKYLAEQEISYPTTRKKASEIWEFDRYKTETVLKHPDIKKILIVWESDYRNDKNKVIELCQDFLNQK